MDNFLLAVSVIFAIIVAVGYFNEKIIHLTYEIALLIFSILIGCALTVLYAGMNNITVRELLDQIQVFNLKRFLVEGVLCFMLFAGSKNLKISAFKENARNIMVLAFICTLICALFYGGLFWLICQLLKIPFTLPMCFMIGSIIAPTDPIAATSILKKFGLPEKVGFLMEAESLLNDGVGVALFVCFSGIVAGDAGSGFVTIMFRD
jgi:CPA1 family monovalent cation:H+ antiporter